MRERREPRAGARHRVRLLTLSNVSLRAAERKTHLLRCSHADCASLATHFCSDCHRDLCVTQNESLHEARSSHNRVPIADKLAEEEDMMREAAYQMRTLQTQVTLCTAELAVANTACEAECTKVDTLKQQLAEAELILTQHKKQRDAIQARLTELTETAARMAVAGSAEQIVELGEQKSPWPEQQLDEPELRFDSGVLSKLNASQKKHFARLLPDIKPVSAGTSESDACGG